MLWLPGRRLHRGLELPKIGELDLAAVESEVVVQDNVHRGATRQFGFGSARKKNGGEACDRADASADPGAFAVARNGARRENVAPCRSAVHRCSLCGLEPRSAASGADSD